MPPHRRATGRPSIKNVKRKESRHQRLFFTNEKKLRIMDFAKQSSKRAAADHFFPGVTGKPLVTLLKRIDRWERGRSMIQALADDPATRSKKSNRQSGWATVLEKEDEEDIVVWVLALRKEGIPVGNLLLACKALETTKKRGYHEDQFKAISTWIEGFKRRWSLALRTKCRSGQANNDQGEAALEAFSKKVKETIRLNDIEDIYNADQTAVNYQHVPDKTLDAKGAKNVSIKSSGHDKDRMIAMLLADAVGTKYPLFLVFKTPESVVKTTVIKNLTQRNSFGSLLSTEIEEIHERHPSHIFVNPSGWWNSRISIKFLEYHFGHRRNQNLKKILLMWDDFGAHFTPDVVAVAEELDIILEKIPPTFTWICQPADVSWMKPLKIALRKRWV
ncbi:hypothetical protein AeRB84_006363 [Aphanomyces euteiches]|nr:hypothetical protein AeRB84_006363 [Aphanomyces euteiches]